MILIRKLKNHIAHSLRVMYEAFWGILGGETAVHRDYRRYARGKKPR